jgi:XTP/dITP diphosphohydrolase
MITRKFDGTELVIATHNKGKLDEIREMFAGRGIRIYSAADFNLPAPEETGKTFLENATLKAIFVAKATNRPALADDSGLGADALDGAPGVYTADWAEITPGGARDYSFGMKKLHEALGDNPNRGGAFTSCLALAWPDGHVETATGTILGQLVWPPRGDKGHGYDPMFQPNGHTQTFAEMEPEQKNGLSHRALSFQLMMRKCF